MDQQQHKAVVRASLAQAAEKIKKARNREGGPTVVQLAEVLRLVNRAVEHQALIEDPGKSLTEYKDI
jgi:uncharacterized protein YicC (UPF0701 family)